MAQVGFTELRNTLATHLGRVERARVELVVTRQNHEGIVILPRAGWEGLRETMHLLGTPANARRLIDSVSERDAGKGSPHDIIEP